MTSINGISTETIALSVMAAQLLTNGADTPGDIDALFTRGVIVSLDKFNELVTLLDGRMLRVQFDPEAGEITVSFQRDPLHDFVAAIFRDGPNDEEGMAAFLAQHGHTGTADCPACAEFDARVGEPVDTMQGTVETPRDPASDPLWRDLPEHAQTSTLETDAAPGAR